MIDLRCSALQLCEIDNLLFLRLRLRLRSEPPLLASAWPPASNFQLAAARVPQPTENILRLKKYFAIFGEYFTFPAVLKNSAVAPIWSEHLHPPSCLCLGWRHLALFQSHLKRTVTGPAIKMDKSQSTLLCLLSTSQISKIHSKLAS